MPNTQSLPRHVQICEMLIRDIHAGRLLPGERLPPERGMASDLGISVGTLRKALADLTAKGLLERRQGSGNYVRAGVAADSVYAFFRLELVQGGGLPTAQVLTVDTLVKPEELPAFGRSERAHRIRRLRLLNGMPAALEEIWLDQSYAPELAASDLSESLYLYYKTRLGLWITRAEDRIGLGTVPDWGAGLLPLRPGEVTGLVERESSDQDNVVAEVSRTWFDNESVRYVSRLR